MNDADSRLDALKACPRGAWSIELVKLICILSTPIVVTEYTGLTEQQ